MEIKDDPESQSKAIRCHFKEVADTYDELATKNDMSHGILSAAAVKNIETGDKVLDIACGTGLVSEPLMRAGAEVFGVDGEEAMLSKFEKKGVAKDHLHMADLMGNGVKLPYASDYFDCIVCNGFLYYVRDFGPLFAEAQRVLKSGGRFHFSFEEEYGEDGKDYKIIEGRRVSKIMLEQRNRMVYFHNRPQTQALLAMQGFSEVDLTKPTFVHNSPTTGRPVYYTFVDARKTGL